MCEKAQGAYMHYDKITLKYAYLPKIWKTHQMRIFEKYHNTVPYWKQNFTPIQYHVVDHTNLNINFVWPEKAPTYLITNLIIFFKFSLFMF